MAFEIIHKEIFKKAKGQITKVKIVEDDGDDQKIEITINTSDGDRIFRASLKNDFMKDNLPFKTSIGELHGTNVKVDCNTNIISVL